MIDPTPTAIVASIPANASKLAVSIALKAARRYERAPALKEARKTAKDALQSTEAWQEAKRIKDDIKARTKQEREEAALFLRDARTDQDYVNAKHAADVLAEQVKTLAGLIDAEANDARQILMPFAREVETAPA